MRTAKVSVRRVREQGTHERARSRVSAAVLVPCPGWLQQQRPRHPSLRLLQRTGQQLRDANQACTGALGNLEDALTSRIASYDSGRSTCRDRSVHLPAGLPRVTILASMDAPASSPKSHITASFRHIVLTTDSFFIIQRN